MKLNEILESAVRLTERQKALLLKMQQSPTSEMAYSVTVGDDERENAKILDKMGFIKINSDQGEASVTPAGNRQLVSYNLLDENGEPTEYGSKLLGQ